MQRNSTNHKASIGPMYWIVPSATTRGVTYEVVILPDGRLACNCIARMLCWHIKACASGAMGKPRLRYCPKPATATGRLPVDDLYS